MDSQPHEEDCDTDLYTASALGDIITVKDLISRPNITKNISKKNEEGWTPLMYACFNGHKTVVEYLISHAANKKVLNNKNQSAFMIAAGRDDADILKQLYEEDFINATDCEGKTSLFYAVQYGCVQSVKWLLKYKEDPNYIVKETGDSLIMLAVKNNLQEIVKLLLRYEINLDVNNNMSETATSLAIKLGYYDIAMLMEAHKGGNNLYKVLENLSLQKYWSLMEKNNIDLSKFLTMNEDDLKDIGITLLGPRRKMAVLISEMNAQLMDSISYYVGNK